MDAQLSTTGLAACPPRLSELGPDLLRLNQWQVAWSISLPFAAFAAFWIFANLQFWPLAILSTIVLSFVTYGSTSHDLVHGNLGLTRGVNHWLLAIIEGISLRSGHAYQAAHLHHHARFPAPDDIESQASRMTWPRALLEGVIFQFRVYAWAVAHAPASRIWIVAEGIGVTSLIASAPMAVPWTIAPAVYVGLMIAGSWIIPLITSYLPHDATAPDALHQTRLFRGWFVRIVALDHLYHLEHHLYPGVPHLNWPRLARRLDPWLTEVGLKSIRGPI